MDLTVAGEMEVLGEVYQGIDLLAFVDGGEVDLAFADIISASCVLVKDAKVKLVVLGALFDGKGEGLVPDRGFLVLQDFSPLLVVLVQPEFDESVVLCT